MKVFLPARLYMSESDPTSANCFDNVLKTLNRAKGLERLQVPPPLSGQATIVKFYSDTPHLTSSQPFSTEKVSIDDDI